MRVRLRYVEFVGEREYPQGLGLTYEDLDISLDLEEGEQIVWVEPRFRGVGFDGQNAMVRVWVQQELHDDEPGSLQQQIRDIVERHERDFHEDSCTCLDRVVEAMEGSS